jgi:hypothetical protein
MISLQIKEQGLLFSTPMMLALVNGTKSMTRRSIKPAPPVWASHVRVVGPDQFCWTDSAEATDHWPEKPMACFYGRPGDLLWARETWRCEIKAGQVVIHYQADNATRAIDLTVLDEHELVQVRRWAGKKTGWNPSIHMPRWASRVTLEITAVRPERLQEISEEDAIAEGVGGDFGNYTSFQPDIPSFAYAKNSYRSLWESLAGPGSWNANPWLWVIEFRKIEE